MLEPNTTNRRNFFKKFTAIPATAISVTSVALERTQTTSAELTWEPPTPSNSADVYKFRVRFGYPDGTFGPWTDPIKMGK